MQGSGCSRRVNRRAYGGFDPEGGPLNMCQRFAGSTPHLSREQSFVARLHYCFQPPLLRMKIDKNAI